MKITVIGVGNMGKALIRGIIKNGVHAQEDISIYDIDINKSREISRDFGVKFSETLEDSLNQTDVVLLAVKPQDISKLIPDIGKYFLSVVNNPEEKQETVVCKECGEKGCSGKKDFHNKASSGLPIIVSIAAGIPTGKIKELLGSDKYAICRVMPNTPALIGRGTAALCFDNANDSQKEYCLSLFGACGVVVSTEEKHMDAVTAVSGSGPAYGMILIEEMAKGGVELGLDEETALFLAAHTVEGAASLVIQQNTSPGVLVEKVSSPGGTTIAAINVLEENKFRDIIRDAVKAAGKRSKELGQQT